MGSLLSRALTGNDMTISITLSSDDDTLAHELVHLTRWYDLYLSKGWLAARNSWSEEGKNSESAAYFYDSLWRYLLNEEAKTEDSKPQIELDGISPSNIAQYLDTRTQYDAQSELWKYLIDMHLRFIAQKYIDDLQDWLVLSDSEEGQKYEAELQIAIIEQRWQTGRQKYPSNNAKDTVIIRDLIKRGWITENKTFFLNFDPAETSGRIGYSPKTRFIRQLHSPDVREGVIFASTKGVRQLS